MGLYNRSIRELENEEKVRKEKIDCTATYVCIVCNKRDEKEKKKKKKSVGKLYGFLRYCIFHNIENKYAPEVLFHTKYEDEKKKNKKQH